METEPAELNSRRNMCALLKTIISALETIASLCGAITFFCLRSYEAGIWLCASCLMGCMALNLNYIDLKNKLPEKYNPNDLVDMRGLGIMFAVAGFSGTLWYLFKYLYYHLPILPIEHSVVIAMIGSIMTFQMGVMVVYYTFSYRKKMLTRELLP